MPTYANTKIRVAPRNAIERMLPYRPPTGNRGGRLRLDFNENTAGCSPRVIARLREVATPDFLATYPAYEDAAERFAGFYGVAPGELLLGDGSEESIRVLVQTYAEPGDEVLLPWPSFPIYRLYADAANTYSVRVPFREPDLAFPLEELIDAVSPRTRAVLIANPNNPTGGATDLGGLTRLLEAASHAAVLIDEAYFEFHGVTAAGLIGEYPNLFVTRTFSKAYGLAAMRVGCILSQADNIAALRKAQSPYSVNSLGVECALAAMEDQEYVANYVKEVVASRELLSSALQAMGQIVYPSRANFVLSQLGERAAAICAQMRERGFLLRDRQADIPGTVRITVGPVAQTEKVIAALREVIC